MSSEAIAREWISKMINTLEIYDFNAHMNLISKNAKIFDLTGIKVINYDDWYKLCEEEFLQKSITSAQYTQVSSSVFSHKQIMFNALQIIHSRSGAIYEQAVEHVIVKEDEGEWRLVQQRALTKKQAKKKGLKVNIVMPSLRQSEVFRLHEQPARFS